MRLYIGRKIVFVIRYWLGQNQQPSFEIKVILSVHLLGSLYTHAPLLLNSILISGCIIFTQKSTPVPGTVPVILIHKGKELSLEQATLMKIASIQFPKASLLILISVI